jgi:hypothetical protein
VRGDKGVEPNERFAVSIENVSPGYGIGRGTSTATIVNDDVRSYPMVGVGDSSVVVGAAGDRQLAFPVTLSRPLTKAVRVKYTLTGVTAVSGTHYSGTKTGTLTIPAGTTTVFKTVNVKPAKSLASARVLRITLSGLSAPAGTKLFRTLGLGTLLPN